MKVQSEAHSLAVTGERLRHVLQQGQHRLVRLLDHLRQHVHVFEDGQPELGYANHVLRLNN